MLCAIVGRHSVDRGRPWNSKFSSRKPYVAAIIRKTLIRTSSAQTSSGKTRSTQCGAISPVSKPGFLTVGDITLADSFTQLIEEIESPELTEVLSDRFGLDLTPFPRLTTIRRLSQLKDGRIHTDGQSKVMTMLVYLNDTWDAESAGRLRVLYDGEHFEPYACEVPPVMGTVFGFLRSDHSWHGHPPFAGERRVVQTAWIRDAAELERKKKRNTFAKVLKGIFGR
ncbi:2OG-Fe(II) oxygenase [Roseibium aggregatum]|uniref:2OG-Fe(II) oxygenase n=1 Tax=Roseibium aggregatum TaxID=187304 RepID=UPI001F1A644B|nr:2OG-Fe(II) oxygenase [Roseibium aggregatum]